MRVNHFNGLLVALAATLVTVSGCSSAPTAAPAQPAPVQPAGGQPLQQVAPVDPCPQPAPLAADPCNPCDGVGPYGGDGVGPYGGDGGPYFPYGAPISSVFFDPFAFNSVVFESVVVKDDVRPSNVIRDTDVTINGNGNSVVFNQKGRGGNRIDNVGVEINGNDNTVKFKQGRRRK